MSDTIYHIYKHTSRITNKAYIGVTVNLRTRWNCHTSLARHGSEYYFHRAIRKHGEETWKTEILQTTTNEEEAYNLEINLIAEHNTFLGGYNLTPGGRIPPVQSGRNHPMFGKTHSILARQKISLNHINVSGANNPRARSINLCSPEGTLYEIRGTLKQFCKSNGIGYSTACGQLCRNIIPTRGTFVGWNIWYSDEFSSII